MAATLTWVSFTMKRNSKEMEKKRFEDVPLVEFTYLVFTRSPGESYRR